MLGAEAQDLIGGQLQAQNVLLVILDDVGVDKVAAYGEHPLPPSTPHMDALAARGVLFRTAWANPFCSPTRATLMTGRFGFRTGIGAVISPIGTLPGLSLSEFSLPEAMQQAGGHRTALLGKWHLGGNLDGDGHARNTGFDFFAGSAGNLGATDAPESYYAWEKITGATPGVSTKYATTDTVDDAVRLFRYWSATPWFVVVSFNSAHKPYHRPPPHLHSETLGGDPEQFPIAHHRAMVESMDAELGRLLAGIDAGILAQTHVIVVGDNGTQNDTTEAPFVPGHGKGTLFEGGLRVPLIVAGPAVAQPGSECTALVQTTDLFDTCLELGTSLSVLPADPAFPRDSISLRPYLDDPGRASLRKSIFGERFSPNHNPTQIRRAIRGPRFKLTRNEVTGIERLYDLLADPFEGQNLMLQPLNSVQRQAYLRLKQALIDLLQS
ncbi:MAG: arylsulfatase B [Planctomycetota bacterium]|jgi:arylsulfatase B